MNIHYAQSGLVIIIVIAIQNHCYCFVRRVVITADRVEISRQIAPNVLNISPVLGMLTSLSENVRLYVKYVNQVGFLFPAIYKECC